MYVKLRARNGTTFLVSVEHVSAIVTDPGQIGTGIVHVVGVGALAGISSEELADVRRAFQKYHGQFDASEFLRGVGDETQAPEGGGNGS